MFARARNASSGQGAGHSTSLARQFSFSTDYNTLLSFLYSLAEVGINILALHFADNGTGYNVDLVTGTSYTTVPPNRDTEVVQELEKQGIPYKWKSVTIVITNLQDIPGVYLDALAQLRVAGITVTRFYATESRGMVLENDNPIEAARVLEGRGAR
jgi:hypothetical protein